MLKNLLAPALTGKGPNFSELNVKECVIGDDQLRYKLPGNTIDVGMPDAPVPSRLNLNADLFDSYDPKNLYNHTFVQMEFEWWAYRGLFLQGDSGLLSKMSLHIDVNRINPNSPLGGSDLESLESYLREDYWNYYEAEKNIDGVPGSNWQKRYDFDNPDEVRAKGYIPVRRLVLVLLPEIYVKERINGVEWLHYSIDGEGIAGANITYYWAYPLTNNYYLTFSFRTTTELGRNEQRYQRMLEDAKRIMSMVELRKE
ncbi:hypothetical protein [Hahella sp. NBU794]|uniref:hypothetical protein n=1 Tax=Hahella sp. NBU794 TaxID=3422590 RepID=UPI003D6DD5B2